MGPDVHWSQTLAAIRTAGRHVDLQMRDQFFANGFEVETLTDGPAPLPPGSTHPGPVAMAGEFFGVVVLVFRS